MTCFEGRAERDGARSRVAGNGRYTVGVLAGWPVYASEAPNPFLAAVLQGIARAAADHDCNLLLACGVERVDAARDVQAAWPFAGAGSEVVPVGHWNTDALIIVPPVRTTPAWRYLDDLRASGFPVAFLGVQPDAPHVAIDNRDGIHQSVRHLLEHGHSRIAFVAGEPNDHGDSAIRLGAYVDALEEAGIEVDPALIAYGMHNRFAGRDAMRTLLQRGGGFSALVASNDQSALGAMDVLAEAGLRIPQDVAVVGFDDQPSAAAHVPSLTTVAYPLAEAGYRLLGLTLESIGDDGAPVPSVRRLVIEPQLVRRLSCGCIPGLSAHSSPVPSEPGTARSREERIEAMLSAVHPDGFPAERGRAVRALCDDALAAFERSLEEASPAAFEGALLPILQHIERFDADAHAWQGFVTELREASAAHASRDARDLAEELLHAARTTFSEAAWRRDRRHRVEAEGFSNRVGRVAAQLLGATTEKQIREILANHLPEVGIRGGRLYPLPEERLPEGDEYPGVEEIARRAASAFPEFGDEIAEHEERFHRALVPVVFQGRQLGLVAFDAGRMEPMGILARQIGAGLASARLHAEVLRLSVTDPLSGLRNRAYLDLALAHEIDRSLRYARPLSIVMFDIDRFKDYNDTYGHVAGDAALRKVAGAARAAARAADVLARYGGEEFALVMPGTDLAGARVAGERIRRAVERITEVRRPITVSVGVATFDGTRTTSGDDLIDRADRALYAAKRGGRNRVHVGSHGASLTTAGGPADSGT